MSEGRKQILIPFTGCRNEKLGRLEKHICREKEDEI